MKFGMISRHQPTPEQSAIAAAHGIELVAIGDRDVFTADTNELLDGCDGYIVAHAGLAIRLMIETQKWAAEGDDETEWHVAAWENSARPPESGKASFFAASLHVWTCRDKGNGPEWTHRRYTV